ncbi:S1 RNA-binding domain-containing protein [Deferribacter autotrophicus]|uniref:S1 RNA-binding domain-containing protein n=1 Tax=Deferribacter autotrophicus TaxID=500465 RepID=A0A5A8F130_9BACT|nr:S1 RNA-binding domain-containing protein [Deferribacter autotrophicus]KAA0257778.1 S1 RNA-binding domain-containing protein [Deferribacter autotrophicus]
MQENAKNNNELEMEDFEALLEESLSLPKKGTVVRGQVVQITDNHVLINFGYKSEGFANKEDFLADGELTVKVGDEVDVMVVGVTGGGARVWLSKKVLDQKKDWQDVLEAHEKGRYLPLKVLEKVEKGFKVLFSTVEGFIPDGHMEYMHKQREPEYYIGKVFNSKILKLNKRDKSFLASRKIYLQEVREEEKRNFFEKTKVGDLVKGRVKSIKNYGVFVDVGPIDVFLRKENISWGRVKHPNQFLEIDDVIEGVVVNIDSENEKVEISLKDKQPDPWTKVDEKYKKGEKASGTVVARVKKGYIVELEPGIDGYIPDDELSWLKKANVKLNVRDVVEGQVIDIDNKNKKVVLSLKLLSENPWVSLRNKHPEGSVIKGKVKSITDFGIFVDFGVFIDGLIRKEDISWTEDVTDLSEMFKVGDKVEAKILKIDDKRERISLGIKQLEKNPWREIDKILPKGKVVEVPVTLVTKDYVEVELPRKIKGVIEARELDEQKVLPEELVKVGDTIKAVVIGYNAKDKKVFLSRKKYLLDSEKREVKEFLKQLESKEDTGFSLGNILKDKLKDIE